MVGYNVCFVDVLRVKCVKFTVDGLESRGISYRVGLYYWCPRGLRLVKALLKTSGHVSALVHVSQLGGVYVN